MRSSLIRSLRYLNGRTISPFPTEAEQVCESNAIFPIHELPEDKKHFAELNAAYYRK